MAREKLSPLEKLGLFGGITLALCIWLAVSLSLSSQSLVARFLIGAVAAGSVGVVIIIIATTVGAAAAAKATFKGSDDSDRF